MQNSVLAFYCFNNIIPLPSGLHSFSWEIQAHLNHCSPVWCRCFSLVTFMIFFPCLVFSSLTKMYLGMIFSYFAFIELVESADLTFTRLGKFLAVVSSYILWSHPLSLLPLRFSNSNAGPFIFFPQIRKIFSIYFFPSVFFLLVVYTAGPQLNHGLTHNL